ncbi:MAG TPA: hypothetical protein VMU39_11250 [Solirubrobacteraceae bacterium]|nr:hypothetical protein [Solirubrobacteraceae bacterium]
MSLTISDRHASVDRLADLVQELLDAHCDTVCLAGRLRSEPDWAPHLEYLRDLQRVGKRMLAELP